MADTTGLRDVVAPRPVVSHTTLFSGRIFDVACERVDLGAAGIVDRDIIDHPGAVAIVAMDDDGRVAVINQYRHAVRSVLWEIPAGLLDIAGEPADVCAARELAEETDLQASTWHVLADFLTSPGFTNESLRIFLARDLTVIPPDRRHVRTEEEADMEVRWVPLDEAVARVLDGSIHSPSAVIGILAAHTHRNNTWSTLRPANTPMPYRRGNLPA
ncbi:MAG: NUDIX hydrolase [Cellulomonadaceae bacterium]|jgi:ADP-ribose pyrophosphatase|nr:NUDIX hydrolase [Cellulomonadaceae bacterium]